MSAVRLVLTMALLLLMASCIGGSNKTPTGVPVSITLLASQTTALAGHSITVTAIVHDTNNQGATWLLAPVDFGTLSNQTGTSVTYTPPSDFTQATTVTITATSITNPGVSAAVQIKATPIVISLAATPVLFTTSADQTVNAGDQLGLVATVNGDVTSSGASWSIAPASGAGSLTGVNQFGATYVAPPAVTEPVTVTITAASIALPQVSSSMQITVFPSGAGANVAAVTVDGGPVPGKVQPNAAYTRVTVCNPGDQFNCQTIDHVLIDTGSYGLRILETQIPLLNLPGVSDGHGNNLQNCMPFPDGSYLWGPVSKADVYIAGEAALSLLIQKVTSSTLRAPSGCFTGNGTNLNSPALLGANGILGIGPEPTDCTRAGKNLCDGSVPGSVPNLYFSCPSAGCPLTATAAPVIISSVQQVANPVVAFGNSGGDSNGTILELPAVASTQAGVVGTLVFGINTQANNGLSGATVYTTDANVNFTTFFNGQTLSRSFIGSGAAGSFFPGLMPQCTNNTQFFCPPATRNLSAAIEGATQGSSTINFSVDNADSVLSSNPSNAVFGNLAGNNGTYGSCSNGSGSCTFEWGLPFFYGRNVYTSIDGQSVSGAPGGAWWAF